MTLGDFAQAIAALDLPDTNNPEFTGVLKLNNKDIVSEINSKLSALDPTIKTTNDDLLMFTGATDISLKQLLAAKLNATALDNTVVTTNTSTDPVIVGDINYKETASDTDSINMISEISNKANLNAPNLSTSLQLNSTNVLLQPGDINGTHPAYIELKAPEQTPPDLSGLISKPGDYADNNLETYIQLKAPEPDISTLIEKPADYADSDLESYIELKALKNPTFILEDIAGPEERITFSDIVTAYAPPPANLTGYADRKEVVDAINFELENYTTTADINSRFDEFSTSSDEFMPTWRVHELLDEKGTAIVNVDNRVYAIETELSYAFDDPTWNMSDIGINLTFEQVVYAYAPPPDLSTLIEKPADYAGNDLASYIQSKAPPANLTSYADRNEVVDAMNVKLENYTTRQGQSKNCNSASRGETFSESRRFRVP